MFYVNRLIDVSFLLDMFLQFFISYIDIDTGAWEYRYRPIAMRRVSPPRHSGVAWAARFLN